MFVIQVIKNVHVEFIWKAYSGEVTCPLSKIQTSCLEYDQGTRWKYVYTNKYKTYKIEKNV